MGDCFDLECLKCEKILINYASGHTCRCPSSRRPPQESHPDHSAGSTEAILDDSQSPLKCKKKAWCKMTYFLLWPIELDNCKLGNGATQKWVWMDKVLMPDNITSASTIIILFLREMLTILNRSIRVFSTIEHSQQQRRPQMTLKSWLKCKKSSSLTDKPWNGSFLVESIELERVGQR